MRRTSMSLAVAVMAIYGLVPAAWAGSATANLAVTADISPACVLNSVGDMAFGTFANIDKASTAVIEVTCTSGTTATLGLGDGLHAANLSRAMANVGGDHSARLRYNLFSDAGHEICWGGVTVCATPANAVAITADGTAKLFTVYGLLPGGQSVFADRFADTVAVTVSW